MIRLPILVAASGVLAAAALAGLAFQTYRSPLMTILLDTASFCF